MDESALGQDKIPKQLVGSAVDVKETIEFDTEVEAIAFFKKVKQRFYDVNTWGNIADFNLSTFILTDHSGLEVKRMVKKDDLIRIDIPGPGTQIGEGYDWVRVEEIAEEIANKHEVITLKVRPAANPHNNNNNDVAHFYTDAAVSTFQIKRIENQIFAEEHGRNTLANTSTESTIDNIRNGLVSFVAQSGLTYPQWKSVVKGWLKQ